MQPQEHWRRLLLRTEATAERYVAEQMNNPHRACPLCLYEGVEREFTYWVLMKNKFPYDRYFSKSDMLVLRRHASEQEVTDAERAELFTIRTEILTSEYDSVMDHLPRQKSIPGHYHVHLIEIRRHDGLPR